MTTGLLLMLAGIAVHLTHQGADCRWLLLRNLMTRPDATPEQVKQAIQHTQSYLIDLGIESLNENSEWLLMHRVTPTNPVIPAG
jgi:hypothetical protein